MEKLSLNLSAGPDGRKCLLEFSFQPNRDDSIDCNLRIRLDQQLDLTLTGFLFDSSEFERLQDAIELRREVLSCPVSDSDCLLTINAVRRPEWIEWSILWEGVYPAFPPFDPEDPPKSKVSIQGLRAIPNEH